jgi:hypothetical protein
MDERAASVVPVKHSLEESQCVSTRPDVTALALAEPVNRIRRGIETECELLGLELKLRRPGKSFGQDESYLAGQEPSSQPVHSASALSQCTQPVHSAKLSVKALSQHWRYYVSSSESMVSSQLNIETNCRRHPRNLELSFVVM